MTILIIWAFIFLFFLFGALVERYYLHECPETFFANCHVCGFVAEGPDMEWVKSALIAHGDHTKVPLHGEGWVSPYHRDPEAAS